jgi:hypothetical protein
MFGRLFGVILATLLDYPNLNLGKISEAENGLQSIISGLLSHHPSTQIPSEEKSPTPVQLLEPPVDQSSQERFEKEERALVELKRQLCEKSKSPQVPSDRSVDLIRHSTSLFDGGVDCSYHICPFANKSVFEGLICHLGKCCGGNPHEKAIIRVTVTP